MVLRRTVAAALAALGLGAGAALAQPNEGVKHCFNGVDLARVYTARDSLLMQLPDPRDEGVYSRYVVNGAGARVRSTKLVRWEDITRLECGQTQRRVGGAIGLAVGMLGAFAAYHPTRPTGDLEATPTLAVAGSAGVVGLMLGSWLGSGHATWFDCPFIGAEAAPASP